MFTSRLSTKPSSPTGHRSSARHRGPSRPVFEWELVDPQGITVDDWRFPDEQSAAFFVQMLNRGYSTGLIAQLSAILPDLPEPAFDTYTALVCDEETDPLRMAERREQGLEDYPTGRITGPGGCIGGDGPLEVARMFASHMSIAYVMGFAKGRGGRMTMSGFAEDPRPHFPQQENSYRAIPQDVDGNDIDLDDADADDEETPMFDTEELSYRLGLNAAIKLRIEELRTFLSVTSIKNPLLAVDAFMERYPNGVVSDGAVGIDPAVFERAEDVLDAILAEANATTGEATDNDPADEGEHDATQNVKAPR